MTRDQINIEYLTNYDFQVYVNKCCQSYHKSPELITASPITAAYCESLQKVVMKNENMETKIREALQRQDPLPPVIHELGGGYYYTCHWLKCGETLNRFMEYCPKCGQRILWENN